MPLAITTATVIPTGGRERRPQQRDPQLLFKSIVPIAAPYNATMHKSGEPDPADIDFFQRLRRELEHQIATYVYGQPEGSIGVPLSADYICSNLNAMRLCLVEPSWEEVNIHNSPLEMRDDIGIKRVCVTMAEDDGYVLVFDPIDEEYHLAWRGDNGLNTWGIRGDGVDCFIAR